MARNWGHICPKFLRHSANCAALPTANAGQYATLHSKLLLFWFP